MSQNYNFRPGVFERTSVFVGIAGPSSSGKTFSALRLATGLAQGGPIFGIDTETGRMLHYADDFDFLYSELNPPFRPSAYLNIIKAAAGAGAKVIIVDSMSHEHEGIGGILEWHDEELDRMAGDSFDARNRLSFAAWKKPKAEHNEFVNEILRLNVHIIFCFRAKEKLKMIKNKDGKNEPTPIGWQPICSDRFEYEMTSLLMLPPNSKGCPDTDLVATKIEHHHQTIFENGKQIDEGMGAALAAWADKSLGIDKEAAMATARSEAEKGTEAFRAWWQTPEARKLRPALKDHTESFKKIAAEADSQLGGRAPAENGEGGADAEAPSDIAPGDAPSPDTNGATTDVESFIKAVRGATAYFQVEALNKQHGDWLISLEGDDAIAVQTAINDKLDEFG